MKITLKEAFAPSSLREELKIIYGHTLPELVLHRLIKEHGYLLSDYFTDCGFDYKTDSVLNWMGY